MDADRQLPAAESDVVVIMITAGSPAEARAIADVLLERRLVACANLVAGVQSHYWWKGVRESSDEVLIIAKSRGALFERVEEAVRAAHSYEVFELVALPVAACSPAYARWVMESTAG